MSQLDSSFIFTLTHFSSLTCDVFIKWNFCAQIYTQIHRYTFNDICSYPSQYLKSIKSLSQFNPTELIPSILYGNYILSEVQLSEQLKISQASNFKAFIPEFLKDFDFRTPLHFLKVIEDLRAFVYMR